MSIDDFCRCTPAEFRAIADSYVKTEERHERSEWNRTRMMCVLLLQPYISSSIDPQELMRFPWEEGTGDQDEKLTTKEIWDRFERVKREQGLL